MPPTRKKNATEPKWPPINRLNAPPAAGARGVIIERFATTEAIIDLVICTYYFPVTRAPREFQDDILFNESFSFALRRSIFERILQREKLYDEERMKDIRRMNTIRNLAAHLRGADFEERAMELAAEFLHTSGRVEKYLARIVVPKLGTRVLNLLTREEILAQAEE